MNESGNVDIAVVDTIEFTNYVGVGVGEYWIFEVGIFLLG